MRILMYGVLGVAAMSIASCANVSPQENPHRHVLDSIVAEMRELPIDKQPFRRSETDGSASMKLETIDGSTVWIKRDATMQFAVLFYIKTPRNKIRIDNGECMSFPASTIDCGQLSKIEWRHYSDEAIAFANRNGGKF